MTFKEGKYYCDNPNCRLTTDRVINKGTGFTFPDPNYHLHQVCFKDMQDKAIAFLNTVGIDKVSKISGVSKEKLQDAGIENKKELQT